MFKKDKKMNWYKKAKWTEHLMGGRADGKKPSDFDPKSIEVGKKIEMEHTDDPDIAEEIATDHLEEHKFYYDKGVGLPNMEKELKKIEK